MSKRSGLGQGSTSNSRASPDSKNILEATSYLLPLASESTKADFMNGIQNLREHQLSSVHLVVSFWLAVR